MKQLVTFKISDGGHEYEGYLCFECQCEEELHYVGGEK